MHPVIVEKDQIILGGLSFFGDPFQTSAEWTEENEIGRLWKRFMKLYGQRGERIKSIKNNCVFYEVQIVHEETESKGLFEVFVGIEINEFIEIPVELLIKILPPAKYAVFTIKGQEIISDWTWKISYEWLPQAGYEQTHQFNFQLYDSRFKGLDRVEESVIDVYIPVK